MDVRPFRIERYYARHEFTTRYMLSSSDCESRTIESLLELEPDAHARLLEYLVRVHRVAGRTRASCGDRRAVRANRSRRGDRHLMRRGGHLPGPPRAAAGGRPRDRRDAVLRVGARAGAQHRGRGEPRGAAATRMAGPTTSMRSSGWCARSTRVLYVNQPHNPTGTLMERADVRARRRTGPGQRHRSVLRRGLPRARARRRDSPAGRLRPRRARRLAGQHLQELRPARAAARLDRHP